MVILKNRLRKLENKLDKKIRIEDIIRLLRHKDSLSTKEQNQIIASDLYNYITNFQSIVTNK